MESFDARRGNNLSFVHEMALASGHPCVSISSNIQGSLVRHEVVCLCRAECVCVWEAYAKHSKVESTSPVLRLVNFLVAQVLAAMAEGLEENSPCAGSEPCISPKSSLESGKTLHELCVLIAEAMIQDLHCGNEDIHSSCFATCPAVNNATFWKQWENADLLTFSKLVCSPPMSQRPLCPAEVRWNGWSVCFLYVKAQHIIFNKDDCAVLRARTDWTNSKVKMQLYWHLMTLHICLAGNCIMIFR